MSVSQVHHQFQSLPGKDLRLRGLVKDLRNGHLAWPEARWKQAGAATRGADKKSLANMKIAGIDPIATMVKGGRISDHDPRVARRSGPSQRGWGRPDAWLRSSASPIHGKGGGTESGNPRQSPVCTQAFCSFVDFTFLAA